MLKQPVVLLAQILHFALAVRAPARDQLFQDAGAVDLVQLDHIQGSPSQNVCAVIEFMTPTYIVQETFHATLRVTLSDNGYLYPVASVRKSSGQGGSASAMMLKQLVVLLAQVSYMTGVKSCRSNNVCLVLPCPSSFKRTFACFLCSCVDLLVQCGDIEQNPGHNTRGSEQSDDDSSSPSDHELILSLLEGEREIIKRLNEFSTSQAAFTDTLAQYNTRLGSLESSLDHLKSGQMKVTPVESKVNDIEKTMTSIAGKVDELENRSRWNNIIIHGFEEPPDDTLASLCDSVTANVFKDKLKMSVSGMERCHRLGNKQPDKIRPVIIRLVDYREKLSILKNCANLKGSKLYVTEDFSQRVREIRKKLWDSTSENRDRKERVKPFFDKILVNGQFYTWDEHENDEVPVMDLVHT